jgi:hypothetical protein
MILLYYNKFLSHLSFTQCPSLSFLTNPGQDPEELKTISIPAPRRLKLKDYEFKANLRYTVRTCKQKCIGTSILKLE